MGYEAGGDGSGNICARVIEVDNRLIRNRIKEHFRENVLFKLNEQMDCSAFNYLT